MLEIPWISVRTLSSPKEKEQPQKFLQYKIAHEELLKKTGAFFCVHWMESLKNGKCALETEPIKVYCNPFQSSWSLPIRFSFCTCCVVDTFFSCFEKLFLCSLSLVAVPTIWPLINFVTQFLNLEVDLTARWFRFCRLCYAKSSCVLQAQWYTVVYIAFNLTQTCQTPRGKKCETLNQELEKVMRNG